MKFSAIALVAAVSVTTASAADLVATACNTTTFKPWISSPNVTTCNTDIAPYKLYPFFLPNATTYALFCKSKACQQVVFNTLATRPVEGECAYPVLGVKVNFYETLVDDAVKVCGLSTTTAPPPATTAPSPATTAPPPATTVPATTRPACA